MMWSFHPISVLLWLSLLAQGGLGHNSQSPLLPHEAYDSKTSSVQLVSSQDFSDSSLTQSCQDALYATLKCDKYVLKLGRGDYHGSLKSISLTDTVCSTECGQSLSTFHDNVVAQCGLDATVARGTPALSVIDSVWAGWNETCLRSPNGTYCNEIIDRFPSKVNPAEVA
ncbi:uncharacterized protein BO88DRAFT_436747, partial [Aspergillus vadensis CBS 113365]